MRLPPFLANRRLWFMAAFGFLAGLPLPLSGFTLRQWLSEGHVSLAAIGLTANIDFPILSSSYGLQLWTRPARCRRSAGARGWLLLIQPLLAIACVWLGDIRPRCGAGW